MSNSPRTATETAAHHEKLGKRYRELESDFCDLRNRGFVIESFLMETLTETKYAQKFGDNVTIILAQEELEALHFIIGEQQTHVRKLHKQFYADMEDTE